MVTRTEEIANYAQQLIQRATETLTGELDIFGEPETEETRNRAMIGIVRCLDLMCHQTDEEWESEGAK